MEENLFFWGVDRMKIISRTMPTGRLDLQIQNVSVITWSAGADNNKLVYSLRRRLYWQLYLITICHHLSVDASVLMIMYTQYNVFKNSSFDHEKLLDVCKLIIVLLYNYILQYYLFLIFSNRSNEREMLKSKSFSEDYRIVYVFSFSSLQKNFIKIVFLYSFRIISFFLFEIINRKNCRLYFYVLVYGILFFSNFLY